MLIDEVIKVEYLVWLNDFFFFFFLGYQIVTVTALIYYDYSTYIWYFPSGIFLIWSMLCFSLMQLLPCAVLSLLIHPTTQHHIFNRILWAFCVYLEAVSVLPQLRVMQNTKVCFKLTHACPISVYLFLSN